MASRMKTFEITFYRHHQTMYNQRMKMKAQAKNLERLMPRLEKILKRLDKIPNPYQHSKWMIEDVKEL
jgi:hypothetical protein